MSCVARLFGAALALGALVAAGQSVPKTGRIIFSKSFPGSVPSYYEIALEETRAASYRVSPDDDNPLQFELSAVETREIFTLAEKLQFFQRPLESKHKLANMGMKTMRYENGEVRGEARFNYSDDPQARALVDWFEKISETEQHVIALERAAQFDRLGVNKALLLLETSWDRRRIVASQQFLPILEKIAGQKNYLHIAQARAAFLVEKIRAGKPPN